MSSIYDLTKCALRALIEVFNILMHNLAGVKREDFFQLRTATGRRGSPSDHSQTALQTECAEIFLHISGSGYLEQAERGYSEQQDSEQLQKSD